MFLVINFVDLNFNVVFHNGQGWSIGRQYLNLSWARAQTLLRNIILLYRNGIFTRVLIVASLFRVCE